MIDVFKPGKMKAFVSYVIQNDTGHRHLSEAIPIKSPPLYYSTELPVQQVFEWAEKKQAELPKGEKLIVINFFKA